eukprot:2022257-Rhodomonas_salina.1
MREKEKHSLDKSSGIVGLLAVGARCKQRGCGFALSAAVWGVWAGSDGAVCGVSGGSSTTCATSSSSTASRRPRTPTSSTVAPGPPKTITCSLFAIPRCPDCGNVPWA